MQIKDLIIHLRFSFTTHSTLFFCYLFSVIFVSAFAGPGINMWCDTFVFGGTASLSTYVLRTKIPRDMRWRKWPSQQISRRGLPANVINVSCVSPRKFQLDDWFVRENEEFHIFFFAAGERSSPADALCNSRADEFFCNQLSIAHPLLATTHNGSMICVSTFYALRSLPVDLLLVPSISQKTSPFLLDSQEAFVQVFAAPPPLRVWAAGLHLVASLNLASGK